PCPELHGERGQPGTSGGRRRRAPRRLQGCVRGETRTPAVRRPNGRTWLPVRESRSDSPHCQEGRVAKRDWRAETLNVVHSDAPVPLDPVVPLTAACVNPALRCLNYLFTQE